MSLDVFFLTSVRRLPPPGFPASRGRGLLAKLWAAGRPGIMESREVPRHLCGRTGRLGVRSASRKHLQSGFQRDSKSAVGDSVLNTSGSLLEAAGPPCVRVSTSEERRALSPCTDWRTGVRLPRPPDLPSLADSHWLTMLSGSSGLRGWRWVPCSNS